MLGKSNKMSYRNSYRGRSSNNRELDRSADRHMQRDRREKKDDRNKSDRWRTSRSRTRSPARRRRNYKSRSPHHRRHSPIESFRKGRSQSPVVRRTITPLRFEPPPAIEYESRRNEESFQQPEFLVDHRYSEERYEIHHNYEKPAEKLNEVASTSSRGPVTLDTQVPVFDPETSSISVYEWFNIFNEAAELHNWSVEDRKFHFANKLAGSARRWFISSKMINEKWGKIKSSFKRAFPSDIHYYEQLLTMMNRFKRDTETLSTYFYNKIALVNECGITGQKAVSCLIGGLRNKKLKAYAINQNIMVPEDLYDFLCKSEQEVKTEKCYICKSNEHFAHHCPQKQDRTLLNKQGDLYKVVLVTKYLVYAYIDGVKLKAYASMDSDYVTIRQEEAWDLKLPYDITHQNLRYFGKNTIKAIGVCNIKIQVNQAVANVDIYVVSNTDQVIPVVLGRSFSNQSSIKFTIDDDGVRYTNIEEKGHSVTTYDYSLSRNNPVKQRFYTPSSSYRK